jgi:hypothetical protein
MSVWNGLFEACWENNRLGLFFDKNGKNCTTKAKATNRWDSPTIYFFDL